MFPDALDIVYGEGTNDHDCYDFDHRFVELGATSG